MDHYSTVLSVAQGTQGVVRLSIERPMGFAVRPGQAVDLTLTDEMSQDEPRPFHVRATTARTIDLVFWADFRADPFLCRYASLVPGDWVILSPPFSTGPGQAYFGGWRKPAAAMSRARPGQG